MQAEPSQIPDDDLLHAIARNDEAALAAIYDRYRLILFLLAFVTSLRKDIVEK